MAGSYSIDQEKGLSYSYDVEGNPVKVSFNLTVTREDDVSQEQFYEVDLDVLSRTIESLKVDLAGMDEESLEAAMLKAKIAGCEQDLADIPSYLDKILQQVADDFNATIVVAEPEVELENLDKF